MSIISLIMPTLPEFYRARRVALGLTQERAAIAAGVSRRTLVDFETGGDGISLGNLNRLMRAVGLELAAREVSPRPTLDELTEEYGVEDSHISRERARGKKGR